MGYGIGLVCGLGVVYIASTSTPIHVIGLVTGIILIIVSIAGLASL